MAKLVHQEGEAAKLSVRAARHKALERAKKALTARDDLRAAEKAVQAACDRHVEEIDRLRAAKDRELKEHR